MKIPQKSRNLLSFLVFFTLTASGFAQGEIDNQPKIFFRNERTWSGSLVSNGWAANYRFARRNDAFSSMIFDVDLASIRHPKEIESQSPYKGGWGRTFVFGKLNEVFVLRGGAGYQKEIFSKFDQGGISIRYFGVGGMSLALLKPIYYQKVVGYNPLTYELLIEEKSPFDPDYMQSIYDIYDKESFFIGLDEIKVNPGFFARGGLCFEYSSEDDIINALEGGIQVEAFLNKVPILAIEDNRRVFFSLFATYRFGKVLDARRRIQSPSSGRQN
jgi:hypothetical protein